MFYNKVISYVKQKVIEYNRRKFIESAVIALRAAPEINYNNNNEPEERSVYRAVEQAIELYNVLYFFDIDENVNELVKELKAVKNCEAAFLDAKNHKIVVVAKEHNMIDRNKLNEIEMNTFAPIKISVFGHQGRSLDHLIKAYKRIF